jgi:hypothetical protein
MKLKLMTPPRPAASIRELSTRDADLHLHVLVELVHQAELKSETCLIFEYDAFGNLHASSIISRMAGTQEQEPFRISLHQEFFNAHRIALWTRLAGITWQSCDEPLRARLCNKLQRFELALASGTTTSYWQKPALRML